MDMHELKQRLQNHFTDGLVTVVGCGLSSAEGLPGMAELAEFLRNEIPSLVKNGNLDLWNNIVDLLNQGKNIEQAMITWPPTPDLEEHIINKTAECFLHSEANVINEVIKGDRTLRFTRLVPHVLKSPTGIPVITTNYDRLIEMAVEMAGLGVDTLFVGHHYGVLNEKESKMSFCRDVSLKRRSHVTLRFSEKVLLLKPHGSLDWFLSNEEPIRCPMNLTQQRLIITPGLNKFRTGYDRPFDTHRDKANNCVDCASRFLIIGYGFNDDHLQTHLEPKLKDGTAALLLVRSLSDNARRLISQCAGMFAITAPHDSDSTGALYIDNRSEELLEGPNLWDLGVFVKEVLEP